LIPITKPSLDKNDLKHIKNVLSSRILTDGFYQKQSEDIIKSYIKSKFVAVTHSCTAALEISSILINLKQGDEVILPSYGFVSIANAIVLRGAKPVFVEINPEDLNISYEDIKNKTTNKTKAIYVIHYAGNACEIEKISRYAKLKKIFLIEDTAHAFLGKYKDKFLTYEDYDWVKSLHDDRKWANNPELTYGEWVKPVWPSNRALVGSIPTPYIFDDRCRFDDAADAIKEWYDIGLEERNRCGIKGHEFVLSDESMMSAKNMSQNFIDHMDTAFDKWKPKKRYSIYKA